MDSSRLFDSARRDPYARRQTPSMVHSTSLSSGQPYYTVESLEGASSLPLLKSGFTSPPEREALLLDVAKKRNFLAAEGMREALLRRNVSDQMVYADAARTRLDGSLPVQRSYVDGLPPGDGRTRLDGLPRSYVDGLPPVDGRTRLDVLPPVDSRTRFSLDELHSLDSRSRTHGLGVRPHDALWPGFDDRARTLGLTGGLALEVQEKSSLSEMIRSGAAPYLRSENYLHGRRDIADVRAPARALDSSLTRRDFVSRPNNSSFKPQSERPFSIGKREPRAPVEAVRKQNKSVSSVKTIPVKPTTKPPPEKSVAKEKTLPVKSKIKPPLEKLVINEKTAPVKPSTKPPSEQSEGWCALCKIDCCNVMTLKIHLTGKKHKAKLEGKLVKVNETSVERKATPAATNQANRKRASDTKTEASQSTKRPKTSVVVVANGTLPANTQAKADEAKEKAKTHDNGQTGRVHCEVCSIFTTGQKNLESHLKGKRHAARLKELANS